MTAPTIVLIVLVALGLGVTIVGLRSLRLGGRPTCRRCGYEIAGLRRDRPALCPECGFSLGRRRAVRREELRGDAWIIALGAALLIPSLIWLGVIGAGQAHATVSTFNWQQLKPDWMLTGDLNAGAPGVIAAARDGLVERIDSGVLTDGALDDAIEHALAMQADRSIPWDPAWGDLILAAKEAGRLTPAQEGRYVLEGCGVTVDVRDSLRTGDPIKYVFRFDPRLGSSERRPMAFDLGPSRIDRRHVATSVEFPVQFHNAMDRAATHFVTFAGNPAPYTIQCDIALYELVKVANRNESGRVSNAPRTPVERRTFTIDKQFIVIPKDQDVVSFMQGTTEQQQAVLHSIRCTVEQGYPPEIIIYADAPPVDLALVVAMDDPDGQDTPLRSRLFGSVVIRAGETGQWRVGAPQLAAYRLADIILIPDLATARDTADLTKIWGQSIKFDDVEVPPR